MILSDVLDFESSDEEEEETNNENSENINLSQNIIQSLLKGDDEAINAMKKIRKLVNKGFTFL